MKKLNRTKILSYLEDFKKKRSEKYHIVKIGLFGSLARNTGEETGDIDVVVELEKPSMFDLIGIKQELEDAFDYPVDIVRVRKRMNAFLKNRIDAEAIYV